MLTPLVYKRRELNIFLTKPENYRGSGVHASGLAAAAVLRLADCHHQWVIGPAGFRVGWCVQMEESYPIISEEGMLL